jgi:outer membrane protein OmpA-like peptidoglycan-associated protein
MKTLRNRLQTAVGIIILMATVNAQGQLLKKLTKRAQRSAERTVENRVDREVSKKTDQALDSIIEPGSKPPSDPQVSAPPPPAGTTNDPATQAGGQKGTASNTGGPKSIEVYSKFDFVPGDKPMFFDDFANDFIGDFPSKWNTNGSGEVVTVNDSPEKWMEFVPGYNVWYIPNVESLPGDYTIEFDLLTSGMDKKTSSTAGMTISLSDDAKFGPGDHYVNVWLPTGQYGAFDIRVKNYVRGSGSEINNAIRADLRSAVLNRPHVSMAINGQRFRLWVNEEKYVDIPQFIPAGKLHTLKFNVNNLKDGKERLFITNLKVAEGGVDLRRQLLAQGKVSTNGILFDSGSAIIQPQSMGVIRQISQVLQQEGSMALNIVGHTDADGSDVANMKLSADRAAAVKDALVNVYGIDASRLSTEGKGESEPVADNASPEGKAQNRRVEFIKI